MNQATDQLKYPIGKFRYEGPYTAAERAEKIAAIKAFPAQLRAVAGTLTEEQLKRKYRPDGWTIRQVVHHVADSHLNSIIRFKLALTEKSPTIKPYLEAAWAELPDTANTPVEVSLQLLEALHIRWGYLLDGMADPDWQRTVIHPERQGVITLDQFLGLYAWHGRHHLEHIRVALQAD